MTEKHLPLQSPLRGDFLEAMSHTAATVSIITTDGPSGRAGVTVSSMTSVSADGDAPMLLVCIHQNSPVLRAIEHNASFCVNVLRDHQIHLSDVFAGRVRTANNDRFSGARWRAGTTSAPQLVGALVTFDCHHAFSQPVGTHHVLYGQVADIVLGDGGQPLLYARRGYNTLRSAPLPPEI